MGLDGESEAASGSRSKARLLIRSEGREEVLSPAQVDFNKRMVGLEKGRMAFERERMRRDEELEIAVTKLMPMVERANRAEAEMIDAVRQAAESVKLTARRREFLEEMIVDRADGLLGDPVGLNEAEIGRLEALMAELTEEVSEEEIAEQEREDLGRLREMMEAVARRAGVNLDLDGVDFSNDPAKVARQLEERFAAVGGAGSKPQRKRKPTKAALERERVKKELEDAKKRDFKVLYKQLAKVLHPDLETDPVLKAHKEKWMKRLTTAQVRGDLRDMLAIEMEWLGEEAGNLSKATDEKLRVYAIVLKEQLADLKEQTRMLIREPQYDPLLRFVDSGGRFFPGLVKAELSEEIGVFKEFTKDLRRGGTRARLLINQLADDYGRSSR